MDNTEGSRAIRQIFRARKNLVLRLTDKQMEIVLGSILGDAYIYPRGKICIEHGEKQKNYLFWKFSQLKTAAYPKVSQVVRLDKRTNTQTISWRFFLRQYFRPLRRAFYHKRKKVISKAIKAWMSPLLLAVWYMDDGYLDRGKYPILMTDCYSQQDLNFLQNLLRNKFSLNTLINNRGRLRIRSSSTTRFFNLIGSLIHKNLSYKLP